MPISQNMHSLWMTKLKLKNRKLNTNFLIRLKKIGKEHTTKNHNFTDADLTFVSIHVRRTDYIDYLKENGIGHQEVDSSYYHNAMQYFRERYKVHFFNCSEFSWCFLSKDSSIIEITKEPYYTSPTCNNKKRNTLMGSKSKKKICRTTLMNHPVTFFG